MHVLTGPDHLSALATLSANVGNCQAFWFGVRWGIGHSIGLIVVGTFFILMSRGNDDGYINIPEKVESLAESFVGIFMLALGIYSSCKVMKKRNSDTIDDAEMRRSMFHTSDFEYDDDSNQNKSTNRRKSMVKDNSDKSLLSIAQQYPTDIAPRDLRTSIFDDEEDDFRSTTLQYETGEASLSMADTAGAYRDGAMDIEDHHHHHYPEGTGLSKQIISVCIGIVHGIAGPGGVLGVIPAVQLHNAWLSIVYLSSFCVTSTLVMGTYAALYGVCTSCVSAKSSNLEYRLEVFSSMLSILVGAMWLILLYMGKLHDIFP